MNNFNLIVAEGHWNDYSNRTVKSLFDLLSDLLRSNANAYKYMQFVDAPSFGACMKQIYDPDVHRYLYIGSHGDEDGIAGSSDASNLSYSIIRNRLGDLEGLYLGTCEFGTPDRLYNFVNESNLMWCAGYKNSIDWLDSSALDMAFWKIFQLNNLQRGKKTPLSIIENTIDELKSKYSSLILDLGFNIAYAWEDDDGDMHIEMAF